MTERDIILAATEANIRDHVAALRAEIAQLRNVLAGIQFDVVTAGEAADLVVEHLINDLYAGLDDGGAHLTQALQARIEQHRAKRAEDMRLRRLPQQALLKSEDGDLWIVGAIDQREADCSITLRAIGTNPFDYLDGVVFAEATRGAALAAAAEHVQNEYDAEVKRRAENG